MSIDLSTISQLREKTGAGIGDCKRALEEAGGEIDKAIEILRKKGEIKAAKKSDRATNEGLVAIIRSGARIAVASLACETDFVARNDDFIQAANQLAAKLLDTPKAEFVSWAEQVIKNELIVKIGENIKLGDYGVFSGAVLGSYLHSNKKVAAVVVLDGGSDELASELAMQVAALSPKYLQPADIPAPELEKEKEIYRENLKNEGKPENMFDKIIEGKLAKYYEEVCLQSQVFIKDDSQKISDLLVAAGASVKEFKRFQV
ncbi:MAG: translation elongation factor Ts [Patescibacteria group bacterium]